MVIFPALLTDHGVMPAKIGIAATFEVLGGITSSFFLARIVANFGIIKTLRISAFLYAGAISLIYFYQSFLLWISFIFFMGYFWFVYVITRQAWLNILLTNEQRGVATGLFSMVIALGTAIGPIIVKFSGATNYSSFLISAALVLSSYAMVSFLKTDAAINIDSKKIPLKKFFKKNPRCFMTRFFLDFLICSLMIFTVIFGTKIGLSYEASGLLITSFMITGFFDVWVGFALKKFNPYKLINIGFLGCIYCFIIVILYAKSYPLLLALYFIFGMSVACIYVSVFKITNEDYAKEELVSANATFQIIGSIGALFGGLTTGLLIDIFGTQGFPITIILSCVFYLTFLVTYEKKYSKKN